VRSGRRVVFQSDVTNPNVVDVYIVGNDYIGLV
jgi:hypothetical protein